MLETIRLLLATTPERWQRLIAATPAELLERPPAAGEWAAIDCLHHLLDTERGVMPVRLVALLAGEPRLAPFFPERDGSPPGPTAAVMAAEFAERRVASLQRLTGVTPADLERRAEHGELGSVTLGQLLHEWVAHDLDHTIQAERALMQPFIVGCGPWRPYFRANDLG